MNLISIQLVKIDINGAKGQAIEKNIIYTNYNSISEYYWMLS